jgi:hypothetical protein
MYQMRKGNSLIHTVCDWHYMFLQSVNCHNDRFFVSQAMQKIVDSSCKWIGKTTNSQSKKESTVSLHQLYVVPEWSFKNLSIY